MTDEKKNIASRLESFGRRLLRREGVAPVDSTTSRALLGETKFRWFTLVTIPHQIENKTVETFNDEVASWVAQEIPKNADISFLELYLSRNGLSRLNREIRIEKNAQSLIESVSRRLLGDGFGTSNEQTGVEFNPMGLLITPALQNVFDNAFVVRHLEPPQVFSPQDESEIPTNVSQYLIGSLKVEDARGHQLGETPIRALVSGEADSEGIQHLYTHADFDLLLKAFPDEEFCSYPLGVNIECRLKLEAGKRRVSQVDLDIHDTKLLAMLSQKNEKSKLFYFLYEGGNKERKIDESTDEIYVVDLKSETTLKREKDADVGDKYEIAPGQTVPVAGKVGFQVVLKFTNRQGMQDTDSYRFLFRFFRYALRFSTKTNKLAETGQFVRNSGETIVMLPPMYSDGRSESQTPAFTIRAVEGNEHAFEISPHPDSILNVMVQGNSLTGDAMKINLTDKIEILGQVGNEGDTHYEKIAFILRPLNSLMQGRKDVASKRAERGYAAFVEIRSGRTISLAKPEIVLGRSQFLNRRVSVGVNALTLTRRYVTWVMSAKPEDDVLAYSTVEGTLAQPVAVVSQPVSLGILGTYYVYVGDFEFTILLESTPRTELLFYRT